jgi:hypothetical protein
MSVLAESLLPVPGQAGVLYDEVSPPIFTNFTFDAEGFGVEPVGNFVDEYNQANNLVGGSVTGGYLKLTGTVKVAAAHGPMRLGGTVLAKGTAVDWTGDWFWIKAANVTTAMAGRAAKQAVELWYSTALQAALVATPPTDEDA